MRIAGLSAGTSASVIALWASAAMAQEAPSTPEGQTDTLDEIIVTARKRAENVQEVPIAVTTYSAEDLRQQSATNIQAITQLTPNMYVTEKGSNSASVSFQIRGQYQNETLGTLDPSIGVYVDGVYWARTIGANADLMDIANVQVLKGPQGTLFGRNTTGGAILLATADPDLDEPSGRISTTFGNFDHHLISGMANIPIVEGVLALRLAGQFNERDGYIENVQANSRAGSRSGENNRTSLRAKLLYTPTDRFSLLVSAEHFKLDEAQPQFKLVGFDPAVSSNPTAPPNVLAALGFGFQGSSPTGTATGAEIAAALGAPRGNFASTLALPFYQVAVDGSRRYPDSPNTFAETQTYSATGTLDTGWGELKAIVAYRKTDNSNVYDLDGSPFEIINSRTEQGYRQWTGELQATGAALADRLEYTLGAFYFDEEGDDISITDALAPLNPNNPSIFDGSVKNSSVAVYAQGVYAFTDALRLTAGIRYVADEKSLVSRNRNASITAPGGFTCIVPVALRNDPAVCSAELSETYDAVPYTVGLDYRITDDILLYAKTSNGFRSGGQNLRGGASGPQSFAPFQPETVTDYEVGMKSEYMGGRVRLNLSAFYSDYQDIQKTVVGVSSTGVVFTLVQNAAAGKIYGGEAEFSAVVTDGLRLDATAGVLKTEFTEFTDPGTGVDRSGEPFDFSPEFTGSVSAVYTRPLEIGALMVRADYSYVSDFSTRGGLFAQFTDQEGYGLLNARASLSLMEDRLEVAVFGRNLTEEEYINDSVVLSAPLGAIVVVPGLPRMYGFSLTYKFGS